MQRAIIESEPNINLEGRKFRQYGLIASKCSRFVGNLFLGRCYAIGHGNLAVSDQTGCTTLLKKLGWNTIVKDFNLKFQLYERRAEG